MSSSRSRLPGNGAGRSDAAVSLERYFSEADKVLPARVDVVSGYSGWQDKESLKDDSRVLLVGMQANQMVRMTDETGGDFHESLPFQRCKFMLLQQKKPWLDGKQFRSVADVMKLPAERRPEYLRTKRGMLFNAEEGLSTDEILQITGELAVNEDDQECAVWYRLAATPDDDTLSPLEARKCTKILLPLVDQHSSAHSQSLCMFDTVLDARTYELHEIADLAQQGSLKLPQRVQPVDIQPSDGQAVPSLPNYTIVETTSALWLVGINLADGNFFRVPSHMQSRITVRECVLESNDLKQCMHAVLESLSDSELRIIGPQAEGSLSARCSSVGTPPGAVRMRPEGMQADTKSTSSSEQPKSSSRQSATNDGIPRKTSAPETTGSQEPPQQQQQQQWRRRSLASGKSMSLGGHYKSSSSSSLHGNPTLSQSMRRFSTPALNLDIKPNSKEPPATAQSPTEEKLTETSKALAAESPSVWTVKDVIEKLDSLSLSIYSAQFQLEGVTGELLVQMDDDMLRDDFGISNRFHRLKLLNYIKKL